MDDLWGDNRLPYFLDVVHQFVAFAQKEGGGFGLTCLHDDNGAGGVPVVGDVEVGDVDIGFPDGFQDSVQAAGGIGHFDSDDFVQSALIAFGFQGVKGHRGAVDDEADDAEFGAVAGQHGIDIDVGFGEDRGDL